MDRSPGRLVAYHPATGVKSAGIPSALVSLSVDPAPTASGRCEYVELTPLAPTRSLVVVAAPSRHLAPLVAGSFVIRELDMRIVGEFACDLLTPTAVSYQGLAVGPVQVWATECSCGIKGDCDRLLVVKVDMPLPPGLMPGLADSMVGWAKRIGAAAIVAFDELEVDVSPLDASVVANAGGRERAEALGLPWSPDTIMTGLAASILTHGDAHRIAGIAIQAHRTPAGTDARSAARMIAHLASVLPEVGMRPERLGADAAALEDVVRALQRRQASDSRMLHERALRGYA